MGEHVADTRIIELAGYGRVDRDIFVGGLEGDVIALPLLADVPQRILCTAFVILVQDDQVREIQHVDFFELARRAVFTGHDVDREIDQVDNLAVALANTCSFDNDHVETERLQIRDVVSQHFAGRKMLPSCSDGAHEDPIGSQGIHTNTIAQQRAAGSAAGRIYGQNGDIFIRKAGEKAIQYFVGNATLTGTTGSGDSNYRRIAGLHLPFFTRRP